MPTFVKKFRSPGAAFAGVALIVPEARGFTGIYSIADKIFAAPDSPYKFIVQGERYILLEVVGLPRCVFEILAGGEARIETKDPVTAEVALKKGWTELTLLRPTRL